MTGPATRAAVRHPDEHRPAAPSSGPAAVLAAAVARASRLEREVRRLRGAATADAALLGDRQRRIREAHAALREARRERDAYRADLARVRGSRANRLGRTLLAPARWARAVVRSARRAVPRRASPPVVRASAPVHPAGASATASGPGPRRTSPVPRVAVRDRSTQELREAHEREPSVATLRALVNRLWFHHGAVTDLTTLLATSGELAGALPPAELLVARRVADASRLLRRLPLVPARSPGAAYLPEPGRVMYCAHTTPAFDTHGYAARTAGVAGGLRDLGVDVTVVGRPGYPWDTRSAPPDLPRARHERTCDGVAYVHLPVSAGLDALPFGAYLQVAADAYVREARRSRPAVIHAASDHQTALPALIAARRLGIPFVYEVRGLWEVTAASTRPGWAESERYALQAALETLVATEADQVLAITRQVADVLVERGVDPARVDVLANAADPCAVQPLPRDAAYAQGLGLAPDLPVVLYAGSMVAYEGLDLLVAAAGLLRERGVGCQVVLAGDGPVRPDLEKQVVAAGLAEHVRLVGPVPASDVPRLLSVADLVVCPRRSLPVTELVSPLKPLEAFAAGRAVLLSDVAPHRDLAAEGARARLFPQGSPDGLADALAELLADPDARRALVRAARVWVLDERCWSAVCERALRAHAAAAQHRSDRVVPAPDVASLRVGLIADEFTTQTLAPSLTLVPLDRRGWRAQLADLDLVLVESAWSGNDGQWHRGVGRYSDEEHADVVALLAECRARAVPTVFWNKEDPVHFDRFAATAALCDHVATVDADRLPAYLDGADDHAGAFFSLPFFAQPAIHHPPVDADGEVETAFAHAGSYYGSRYADRSAALDRMLDLARPYGLAIYDRQAGADSPYRFPERFAECVRGSLPYREVIRTYSSHLAHLNVNSVMASPSMYARRVVEIAASGGVVLSGPGRGVVESIGDAIPVTGAPEVVAGLLHLWATDPAARREEAWRQLRAVLRAHTVDTALVMLARAVGVPVRADDPPSYGVVVEAAHAEVLASLLVQSRRPRCVYVDPAVAIPAFLVEQLSTAGIPLRRSRRPDASDGLRWVARLSAAVPRTWAEDVLLAARFGSWDQLVVVAPRSGDARTHRRVRADDTVLARVVAVRGDAHGAPVSSTVAVVLPAPGAGDGAEASRAAGTTRPAVALARVVEAPPRLLVAGHDLKFVEPVLRQWDRTGEFHVSRDVWRSHTSHDESASLAALSQADVVLCEWGLGNAAWYARHVRPGQRLVVRVHLQELDRPYLSAIRHEAVGAYVFVDELVRASAVAAHGVPASTSVVVPNAVDVDRLALPKHAGSRQVVGLVGTVPRRKRLDLALDVLEAARAIDPGFRMIVKGRGPQDYPWMADRPDELAYYARQHARIDVLNARFPGAVEVQGHSDDMPEWYRSVGAVLSVSDVESFHYTIADGAASGAVPAVLYWPGAEHHYPRPWLTRTVQETAERLVRAEPRPDDAAHIRRTAGLPHIAGRLAAILRAGSS